MTPREILGLVRIEVGDPEGDRFTDDYLIDFLNFIHDDFCRFTEILQISEDISWGSLFPTATVGKDVIVLDPFDYTPIHIQNVFVTRENDESTGALLNETRSQVYPKSERNLDYMRDDWRWEYGRPEHYIVWTKSFGLRIHPIPIRTTRINVNYTFIDNDVTLGPGGDESADGAFLSPAMFHRVFVYGVSALCFFMMKEYDNLAKSWGKYVAGRQEAFAQIQSRRSPDIMYSQRPVDVFNYPLWDEGYRTK